MDYRQAEEDYRRFLQGDEEAFSRIVLAYRAPITAFIGRLINGGADAEDLAADVFVELLEHPGRYRFQSSLKTYLFAIAHHRTMDYLRRSKRECSLDPAVILTSEQGPEKRLLDEEYRHQVQAAWDNLKAEYRMAVYLTAVEEMSYKAAAQVMRKTVRQIRDYCRRGRQQLRRETTEKIGREMVK